MKQCSKCKELKTESEFSKKHTSKDGLSWHCKICTRNYTKTHYRNNKKYYKDKARRNDIIRRKKIKAWFINYKSKLKCEQCGEHHISTLDFHHKNLNEKDHEISKLVYYGSLNLLKKEIEKCSVLCSNCHRKHHYNISKSQLDE